MDVSIIIINYNTKQLTNDCIDSIFMHTKGLTFEVILLDNASTDGSVKFFSEDNRITFIANKKNYGFGVANNIGASVAHGNYLFFLNSDTLFLGNAIGAFFSFCEQHKDLNIGVIGGLLINRDKTIGTSYHDFVTPFVLYGVFRNFFSKRGNILSQILKNGYHDVDLIIGADLFMPKTIFDSFGGFDPDYFMLFEEMDLQKRMKNAGYRRIVINNQQIIHYGKVSFNKMAFLRYELLQKSVLIYGKKHFSGCKYIMFRIKMVLSVLFFLLFVYRNETYQNKRRILKIVL